VDDQGSIPGGAMMGIFLFVLPSRPVLAPTQPPIQWAPVALIPGAKRPGYKGDDTIPCSAEFKND